MQTPKISIITVTYNAEKEIEETIKSIINQTYKNIEYIIIDGNSKDNTIGIAQKYKNYISRIISEKDHGLYDAMNKGINNATGDYLWFINAGDRIFNNETLEKALLKNTDSDIYYGETMLVDETGKFLGTRSELSTQKLPQKLTWKKMKYGMVVHHQSIIVKKKLAPLYNLKYRWSADVDWVLHCLKKAKTITNTEQILSAFLTNTVLKKFYAGGASTENLFTSLKERYKIYNKHFGYFNNFFNHIVIAFKALFKAIK